MISPTQSHSSVYDTSVCSEVSSSKPSPWQSLQSLEDIYPFAGKMVIIKNFYDQKKSPLENQKFYQSYLKEPGLQSRYKDCKPPSAIYCHLGMDMQYSPWLWRPQNHADDANTLVAFVPPEVKCIKWVATYMSLILVKLEKEKDSIPFKTTEHERNSWKVEDKYAPNFIGEQTLDDNVISWINSDRGPLMVRCLSKDELEELKRDLYRYKIFIPRDVLRKRKANIQRMLEQTSFYKKKSNPNVFSYSKSRSSREETISTPALDKILQFGKFVDTGTSFPYKSHLVKEGAIATPTQDDIPSYSINPDRFFPGCHSAKEETISTKLIDKILHYGRAVAHIDDYGLDILPTSTLSGIACFYGNHKMKLKRIPKLNAPISKAQSVKSLE